MNIIQIDNTQGALVFQLFDQYRVFYKQPSDLQRAKNYIQERLDNKESVIFVALSADNQTPMGFTQLYPNYSSVRTIKNWTLNDLYVHPDFRKQGVGENLIQTALAFAKQNEARFVELCTATDNYTAQSLYEQIGFNKQAVDTEFLTYRINVSNN
ncbi:MAG TPA: GNAT family N-acetyltransferase [Phnomibacter sp.]|nr:GNAT family N-acetyltransferase [Phnomibacter sp.]